jgi:hypothetical protein
VPTFPLHSFHQQFTDESKARAAKLIAKAKKAIAALTALANAPGSVPKTELKKLVRDLEIEFGNLPGNTAFMHNQFKEAMEHITEAGKTELEAFAVNLALSTGIETLKLQKPEMSALSNINTIDEQSGGQNNG